MAVSGGAAAAATAAATAGAAANIANGGGHLAPDWVALVAAVFFVILTGSCLFLMILIASDTFEGILWETIDKIAFWISKVKK